MGTDFEDVALFVDGATVFVRFTGFEAHRLVADGAGGCTARRVSNLTMQGAHRGGNSELTIGRGSGAGKRQSAPMRGPTVDPVKHSFP